MKTLTFDKIDELKPPFDGHYGWLTMVELNIIDPQGDRFDIVEEATFEDDTVFVLIQQC